MVGIIITLRVSLKRMCNNRADEKRICNRTVRNKESSFAQIKLLIRNWFEKRTIWQFFFFKFFKESTFSTADFPRKFKPSHVY